MIFWKAASLLGKGQKWTCRWEIAEGKNPKYENRRNHEGGTNACGWCTEETAGVWHGHSQRIEDDRLPKKKAASIWGKGQKGTCRWEIAEGKSPKYENKRNHEGGTHAFGWCTKETTAGVWYGYLQRIEDDRLPKNVMKRIPTEYGRRGRTLRSWIEGVENEMERCNVPEDA